MYSKETIKKVALNYHSYMELIKKGLVIPKVHVSKGNRKIGKVLNVSTVPIMDCKNCKECKNICYAVNSYIMHTNSVVPAWTENSYFARFDRKEFFTQIRKTLARRRSNKYFRWHVSGEIIDMDYLENMIQIAKDFPNFKFWTYTKMYDLVNLYVMLHGDSKEKAIPANLVIMFSEWRGMEMYNPYGFPEFRVVFKSDEIKPIGYYCPGNCDICKANGHGCVHGETTYCNEH